MNRGGRGAGGLRSVTDVHRSGFGLVATSAQDCVAVAAPCRGSDLAEMGIGGYNRRAARDAAQLEKRMNAPNLRCA